MLSYVSGNPKWIQRIIRPIKHSYKIGDRFNNYVIVGEYDKRTAKSGKTFTRWECKCDCGIQFVVTTKQIYRGQKSCGCLAHTGRFNQLSDEHVVSTLKMNHYKQCAQRRNISWDLTKNEFSVLLFGNCYYCKSPSFTPVKRQKHTFYVNGVDRLDSNIGYKIDNCVSCCKFCNRAKGDATIKEFTDWLDRLKKL